MDENNPSEPVDSHQEMITKLMKEDVEKLNKMKLVSEIVNNYAAAETQRTLRNASIELLSSYKIFTTMFLMRYGETVE